MIAEQDIARFWARVNRTDNFLDCWNWTAAHTQRGYGTFRMDGRPQPTHRLAWILTNGPIPDGMFVCHRCDNPPCCNPSRLFLGTHHNNMMDMVAKGRSNQVLTDDQVIEVRRLYAEGGISYAELAARFNASKASVYLIVHGFRRKVERA